jgi:hypothetical protein
MKRLALPAATVAAIAAVSAASGAPALPRACKLLKRAEAAAVVGVKVQAADDGGSLCTYNGYPTGPAAQVTVFVTTGVPRTLKIDRSLHHQFRKVPRIGDQAWEEMWAIFARKGSTWVMISVVRSDDWTKYEKPVERAATIAISRLPGGKPSKGGTKTSSSSTAADAGVRIVGQVPAGGGSNSLWRGSQRRFGGSIGQYQGVTYEPGVVVIGGGANAIRSESADGLTWTLSGTAPGVGDLRVGKIMLATTFASGRVLAVAKVGGNVRVTLGPASLTQIVRDGVFDSKGPVALKQPLFYAATLPSRGQKSRRLQGLAAASGTGALFGTLPICCAGGVGVHLSYDNGAGRFQAGLLLRLEKPTVDFRIEIGGGKLVEANLALHGGAALRFDFFGATKNVSGDIKSGPLLVPGSITIPIGGPLSLQFTQRFDASMQLAGAAWMKSSGEYRLSGTLGFGTSGAGFRPDPVSVTVGRPIVGNTASQGIGTNAFSLGWTLRATVGVGVGGFSAGAWYELKPGLAVVMDGMPGSLKQGCVSAAVTVFGKYGVGFTIPEWVASVVNAVLGAAGAKPIATSGGPSSKDYVIWKPPAAEACPK